MFLSAEKNQRTFVPPPADKSEPWPTNAKLQENKSLLLLFFRKEDLP
jgi:hypothetical protein